MIVITEKLSFLADIRSGFTFRESCGGAVGYDGCAVVQVRNVINNDFNNLFCTAKNNFKSANFLQRGDVLITNRGCVKAAVYNQNAVAVANNSLFVVRVKKNNLLPEYVALLINSDFVQKELKKLQDFGMTVALSIKVLRDLEIPMLPVKKQQELVAFADMVAQQERIFTKISDLNNKLINNIIRGALNG